MDKLLKEHCHRYITVTVNIVCSFEVSCSGCQLIAEISSQGGRSNSGGYIFTLSIHVQTEPKVLVQLLQMAFKTFNLCVQCLGLPLLSDTMNRKCRVKFVLKCSPSQTCLIWTSKFCIRHDLFSCEMKICQWMLKRLL